MHAIRSNITLSLHFFSLKNGILRQQLHITYTHPILYYVQFLACMNLIFLACLSSTTTAHFIRIHVYSLCLQDFCRTYTILYHRKEPFNLKVYTLRLLFFWNETIAQPHTRLIFILNSSFHFGKIKKLMDLHVSYYEDLDLLMVFAKWREE